MKPWWKSKTEQVAALTLLLGILTIVVQSGLLSPEVTVWITGIVSPILHMFLRWITDQPITSIAKVFDGLRPAIVERAQD